MSDHEQRFCSCGCGSQYGCFIHADESGSEPSVEASPCCDHYPCDHTGCDCDGTFHNPGPGCPSQPTGRQDDERGEKCPDGYYGCHCQQAVAAERARSEALIGVIPGTRFGGADFIPRNAAMRAVLFGRTSS